MMRLLLATLLVAGQLAAEETQAKPELLIYLWDYEDARSRDTAAVRHLHPFWLSRFVREALEAPTTDPEITSLREDIHALASVRVVDTPEVVDRLKCPAYSFGKWDNAVEFGNWCPVGPEGYRQCPIFREHVGFLKHLKYLIRLVKHTESSSRVVEQRREQSCDLVNVLCKDGQSREIQVTTTTWAVQPMLEPWPPVVYRPYVRSRVSWEAHYEDGPEDVTEAHSRDAVIRGDLSTLLFVTQMDMGTGVLSHEILRLLALAYPTIEGQSYWQEGAEYEIPLIVTPAVTVGAIYRGEKDGLLLFRNADAEFAYDPMQSKLRITRRGAVSGGMYGIEGQWSSLEVVCGTVRKAGQPERIESNFFGF